MMFCRVCLLVFLVRIEVQCFSEPTFPAPDFSSGNALLDMLGEEHQIIFPDQNDVPQTDNPSETEGTASDGDGGGNAITTNPVSTASSGSPFGLPVLITTDRALGMADSASSQKSVEGYYEKIYDRLNVLEDYFRQEGLPLKNTSETHTIAVGTLGPVTVGQSSLKDKINNIKTRADALKNAIEEHEAKSNTVSDGSGGASAIQSGGSEAGGPGNGAGGSGSGGDMNSVISESADSGSESAGTSGATVEMVYTEGKQAEFTDRQWSGCFDNDKLDDVSGIAYSRIHEDIIYAINDNAGDDDVYVVNATDGRLLSYFDIGSVRNYDWEDLAVGPCSRGSSRSCIYIGDFGSTSSPKVYVVPEPDNPLTETYIKREASYSLTRNKMETLLVTPNADIYSLTESKTPLLYNVKEAKYRSCGSFNTEGVGPTGGDISADGTMVLIKVEERVYYYYVPDGDYDKVLCDNANQQTLAYTPEYDGQAIAFHPNGLSYYTASEHKYSPLWVYSRVKKPKT